MTEEWEGDRYRPAVHYSPRDTWMNDPNGLVFHDGEYHLFYQTNPLGTAHRNLSWGHAISTDLVHWRDRPLAISFDDAEQIFSGSIVVDATNSSGLGSAEHPPWVAIYTSHRTAADDQPQHEAQSLAVSLDDGDTWTKYVGNPVLDRGSSDFRDPKVFRYRGDAGEYWVLAAVEAVDRAVLFYRSDDLINWAPLSTFRSSDPVGRIWECPDLIELPVDDEPGTRRWALIVSLNLEADDGGSASIVFVGDFDGTSFTAIGQGARGRRSESDQHEWQWLDHGRDHYAAVTFADAPGPGRVLLGWMSNWGYATLVPTGQWRGAMALPRRVTLRRDGARFTVRQQIAAPLTPLGQPVVIAAGPLVSGVHPVPGVDTRGPAVVRCRIATGDATVVGLTVHADAKGRNGVDIRYDTARAELTVDRRQAGITSFSPHFPMIDRAPLQLRDGVLDLQVVVDTCSVEVFADDGAITVTQLVFPAPGSSTIALVAEGGTAQLESFTLQVVEPAAVARLDADDGCALAESH